MAIDQNFLGKITEFGRKCIKVENQTVTPHKSSRQLTSHEDHLEDTSFLNLKQHYAFQ